MDRHPAPTSPEGLRYRNQPLLRDIYIADPSAHLFDGRIYVYGSHDVEGTTPEDDLGSHFEMRDYHVISMDRVGRAGPGHHGGPPPPEDHLGSHFEMRDYHVISMDRVGGEVTVHPVALAVEDVPWAEKQMWAP